MPDRELKARVEVWLDKELLARVDEAKGPVSRADFIRHIIEVALDQGLTFKVSDS